MKTKLMIFAGALLLVPMLTSAQSWDLKSGLPGNNARHHPITWAIDGYGYVVTGTTSTQDITMIFSNTTPQQILGHN